ncbi:MAG: hypothetical protein EB116_05380 [Betaproteobacteria bacterium]|jgi:nitronate monooxygenase|nr:hypothetical protein [Betaproteobacteria bacterium]
MSADGFKSIVQSLRLPVIQAPMAGGPCTVAFVASVLKEGIIGSFGFAYSKPDAIRDAIKAARRVAHGPVNANFFIFPSLQAPSDAALQQAVQALQALAAFDLAPEDRPAHLQMLERSAIKAAEAPFFPSLEEQLEAVWSARPELLSFHFGLPPGWVFDRARELHIPVLISASKRSEALAIEASGASAIVAQGIEAGGHRGYFDAASSMSIEDGMETLDLVEEVSKHCKLPVVAAGGIMDGEAIRAAIQRGACAVQMGTAFLACDESGASAEHKRLLTQEPQRGTVFTRAFSGRFARGIRNRFTESMQDQQVLPFPQQNTLTGALRQRSAETGDPEYQSLWAGRAYPQCRAEPVKTLLARLEKSYRMPGD